MNIAFLDLFEGRSDVLPFMVPAFTKSYVEKESKGRVFLDVWEKRLPTDLNQYDMIIISTIPKYFHKINDFVQKIRKNWKGPLFLAGVHITLAPWSLPVAFDGGILGEVEVTILELSEAYAGTRKPDKNQLSTIPGICFHNHNGFMQTGSRPLIADLSKWPDPDFSYQEKQGCGDPVLISARGCPYPCKFCLSTAFWKRTIRPFSNAHIVRQISSQLHRSPNTHTFCFADEILFHNKKRFRDWIRLASKEPWWGNVRFSGQLRADMVDRTLCELLKAGNFKSVQIGIESLSQKLLDQMEKKYTVDQIHRSLDLLSESGLEISTSAIIGFPEETEDDFASIYDYMTENVACGKFNDACMSILMPYPGTEYWEIAKRQGLVDDPFDWHRIRHNTFDVDYFREKDLPLSSDPATALRQWMEKRTELRTLYIGGLPEDRFNELYLQYQVKLNETLRQNSQLSCRTEQAFTTITNRIDRNSALKWAIFGIGLLTDRIIDRLDLKQQEFIGFGDNNTHRWGKSFKGFPIMSPDDIAQKRPEKVFACAYSQQSIQGITRSLRESGYKGKIIPAHGILED